ncbi:NmrA family protein [Planoprotostelium fungivorum]|uniref:protein-ribulosamine 3-kinase n=1 Tax=Planoprotostelium fungivorum TaxID=1890364 RepID=A0A2P6NM26_9EUKA|nr:NmrA family protein [Planoprotostelium fungivorum]
METIRHRLGSLSANLEQLTASYNRSPMEVDAGNRRPKTEHRRFRDRSSVEYSPTHDNLINRKNHTMSNTDNKKIILVLGATGKQGGQVISELLAQDARADLVIRALSRNPESAAARSLAARGVQIYKGDLDEEEGLARALAGVDTAFLVTLPDMKDHQREATRGIRFVDEAKKANVSHLIFTSVEDADKNTGVPHFDTKWTIEQHIREVDIPWTILRPVAFMDNFTANPSKANFVGFGVFATLLIGHSLHWVHTRDIGRAAVRAINNPIEYRDKIIPLSGDVQTLNGVLDAYEKVHGKRPWKAYVPRWAANQLPKDFTKMFQYFRKEGFSTDVAACRKADPEMYTVEKWLAENKNLSTLKCCEALRTTVVYDKSSVEEQRRTTELLKEINYEVLNLANAPRMGHVADTQRNLTMRQLPQDIVNQLEGQGFTVKSCEKSGSTSTSSTATLTCHHNGEPLKFFVKIGEEETMHAEFESLMAIDAASPGFCPKPILLSECEDTSEFAKKLAKVHSDTNRDGLFGFSCPTFCGSTRQENTQTSSWKDFFIEMRLKPLLTQLPQLSSTSKVFLKDIVPRLLDSLRGTSFPIQPRLVHGDLWSGNASGDRIFDPCCLYAHSEYELGMMRMFGGWHSERFWSAYHEEIPKDEPTEEFDDRISMYTLYHQLNHAVMFGGGN